jgi:DNA-binding beta-propeller fold protein YncE
MRTHQTHRAVVALTSLVVLSVVRHASAVTLHPGDLIVADSEHHSLSGCILDIDPQTGVQTVISSGGRLVQPTGVAIDPVGNIFVSDFGGIDNNSGAILKIDAATGAQTVISSGGSLDGPTSVQLDPNGQLLVTQEGNFGALLRIDPTTGAQTVITSGRFVQIAQDAAINPHGGILVSSFYSKSGIVNVDPATGTQTVLASGDLLDFGPYGIWIDQAAGHNLLVAARTHGLVGVDILTGGQTLLAAGGYIDCLTDVTQNAFGTTYVTDARLDSESFPGSVVSVDLQTGQQTLISTGGYLATPDAIAVVVPEPAFMAGIGAIASGLLVTSTRRVCQRQ